MDWRYLPKWLADRGINPGVDLNPIFQRGRVWTQEQKIRYLEFRLSGGQTGREIHFNNPSERDRWDKPILLMDGKQRIDAVLEFLADGVPVFGHVLSEYEDHPDSFLAGFHLYQHNFLDPNDILRWYISMNRGGVVHSDDEIDRVRGLIGKYKELTSSPDERIQELMHYPVVGFDKEYQYFAGRHFCGQPGTRSEIPGQISTWRFERCEDCDRAYAIAHPPRPQPEYRSPAKKPRRRR